MKKAKVLVAYYSMFMGGSTTSLLAFLNCIDKTKYDVDLQLYHNSGPLFDDIPEGVNILPAASKYNGKFGRILKALNGIFTGAFLNAFITNKKHKKKGLCGQLLSKWQAKSLSRRSKVHYDYAIGFMEGWPNQYIHYCVTADKKYGWMHNTFANIAEIPELELEWMRNADKIVFVADNCTEDFKKALPEVADKAVTILNITDSEIIRAKGAKDLSDDEAFVRFKNADCFKIITVCRISMYHKGLDRGVACAKRLKDAGYKFLWMIVGDGPQLDELNRLIAEAGIEDCMVTIGNRMNPHPFIAEADLFCMLSRYEGKPMVITESMILGTPPLVAEYLSAHEQINSGVDGLVVENTEDSGYEPLVRFISNPELLTEMKRQLASNEYGNSEYMREIEDKYLS